MTQEQKRHIRQLRAAGEGYKRISTLLDIPVGTIKSFCRRDEADEPAASIRIRPENCVQCRCCTLKCPFDNILWETPQHGVGPDYREM